LVKTCFLFPVYFKPVAFLYPKIAEVLTPFHRGDPLPPLLLSSQPPRTILAADCVYFEPAFPLLITTLSDLLEFSPSATIYFCFKKRRRADMQFMKNARKKFLVEEVEDQDRRVFSREGLFLYTFKRKPHSNGIGNESAIQIIDEKL